MTYRVRDAYFRMIRLRPKLYLPATAAHIIAALIAQGSGLLERRVIDVLSGDVQAGLNIWTLIALVGATRLGVELAKIVHWASWPQFFFKSGDTIRTNTLERILQRPGARALPASPGEAISRFDGDVDDLPGFALWVNHLIRFTTFAVVAFIIMIRINVVITTAIFLPLAGVVLLANAARSRVAKYRAANRRATGVIAGFIGEMYGSTQAIKVATAEENVVQRFRELNEIRGEAALKDRVFESIFEAINWNTLNVGMGIILLLAGRALQEGRFTVGDFSLFVFYLRWISDGAWWLGAVMWRYRQAGVSISRLERLLQGAPTGVILKDIDVHVPQDNGQAANAHGYEVKTDAHVLDELRVEGLTFHYPDSERGIHAINLTLKRGEFTVITGRIGSGKTTLLRVLLGLLPKESGEVFWNGQAVEEADKWFVPPRAAYTAQVPRLFSDTLQNNVMLGLPGGEEAVRLALHKAVMEEDLAEMDEGLQTIVGPKGVRLSGGQVQRSAAARMFVRDPELMVFDDLSSALDVQTEKILWERVFAQQQVTSLVVSHRQTVLKRADRIIVLKDGRVESEGKLADLLGRSAELQWLWNGNNDKASA